MTIRNEYATLILNNVALNIPVNFEFHAFLEETLNRAFKFEAEKCKSLNYFIDYGLKNDYVLPTSICLFVLKELYFKYTKKKIDKEKFKIRLNLGEYKSSCLSILYLCVLCYGGADSAKKFLGTKILKDYNPDISFSQMN